MSNDRSPRRTAPGCFGYGCLIATVIFSLVIGGIWFLGLRSMRVAVKQYTAETFSRLAPLDVDAGVTDSSLKKLADLRSAVGAGRRETFEFSGPEVQSIISATQWRDRVQVAIRGDELEATFAFPLAALGDWAVASYIVSDIKDRALVGDARCKFGFIDGVPKLSFSKLVLNKQELEDLPRGHAAEWIVGAVSEVIKERESAEELVPVLRAIRQVELRDGRLFVTVG